MAKEGIPFLVASLLVAGFFFATAHPRVGAAFLIPTLFIAYFFRDPDRHPPEGEGLLLSPADGKVIGIENVGTSPTGASALKVSIFLSVFDVHINRAPVAGRIDRIDYQKGRFLIASDDDASAQNERNTFVLDTRHGRIAFSQVAGMIARRIVCWKKPADAVVQGEKVGMIRFGSRVDLYVPPAAKLDVRIGDRVKGGETIIGRVR
ncbi:MAG: phosphatidylserine decarboxylase family protein [Acidobacteria bacterium]|nr:phosphatidylserine decarboxylase family protein [Acidobacteriota bacterium]